MEKHRSKFRKKVRNDMPAGRSHRIEFALSRKKSESEANSLRRKYFCGGDKKCMFNFAAVSKFRAGLQTVLTIFLEFDNQIDNNQSYQKREKEKKTNL